MAPRQLNARYQGFSPDTTVDEARAIFETRFGHAPIDVIVTGGAVLAGPIGWRSKKQKKQQ